ncbi:MULTISPECIES: potassium channel family protein [unclassified Blastococcus]
MASRKDPVAVIGLGRFGTAIALELTRSGTEVLAVDSRPHVVQRLSGQLSHAVVADATDLETLNELGLGEFRRVVVAIGTGVEASILATSLLAELGVPHIWAKALSAQHGKILERIGARHVVFPEHEMGERVAHVVSGRLLDWVWLDEEWALATTKPPRELVGVPLGQSGLRKKHRVTVVSVKPELGGGYTHAATDTVLTYGCEIVVAGRPTDVERFVDLQ